ncbi:MAG: extracellular solute-binding protein [Dehalococcoidia bacterium]|nr:extracellular solute-binding protein [Dehalococcoidia bacterium]
MKKWILSTVFILIALVTACGTGATPAPAPTPTTVAPANQVAPKPALEDPAWDMIVQAAKKEGMLTHYSYNLVGDAGIAMQRAFEAKYGIKLEIITGRGAEFLERVKVETRIGQRVADTTEGSALHVKNMKLEGLTLNVTSDLPVLLEKDVWIADIYGIDPKDKHILAFNFSVYTPYINTKIIKPGEEPKVWRDFLDPKWKSKIVATDPLVSGGLYQLFLPLMREKLIDDKYLADLGKQDMRFSAALPDEAGILARGERPLSLRGVDIVYARFIQEGAPIKAISMKDGTVLSVVTIAAFKGAPHPNASKVFINWFLSAEGQDVYSKVASVAPIRKDVKNYLPENGRVNPERPVLLTNEDNEEATRYFRERYLEKLWKS